MVSDAGDLEEAYLKAVGLIYVIKPEDFREALPHPLILRVYPEHCRNLIVFIVTDVVTKSLLLKEIYPLLGGRKALQL